MIEHQFNNSVVQMYAPALVTLFDISLVTLAEERRMNAVNQSVSRLTLQQPAPGLFTLVTRCNAKLRRFMVQSSILKFLPVWSISARCFSLCTN